MQTTKPRNGISPATPLKSHQLKTTGSDPDSMSSPNPSYKNLKKRSPKHVERESPKNPISEKKHTGRVSELESQLTQLQEELKKAKEQLNTSEALKKCAQQEAEEIKKQLSSLSTQLKESQQQLLELSDSEEVRLQELRNISQERDRAWQSELEAVKKQHAMDSSALASAVNEMHRLKKQLEKAVESEAAQSRHAESAHAEIQSLRIELSETLELVQQLRDQINDSKESEAHVLEVAQETKLQLEAVTANAESIQSDNSRATETCLVSELEQSKAQVGSLEKLVRQLQANLADSYAKKNSGDSLEQDDNKNEETKKLMVEIDSLKKEVNILRSSLEASELRCQEEYIQSTMQIGNAYSAMDRVKSESILRELELEEELRKEKEMIEELKSDLISKQATLQNMSSENEGLRTKLAENQTSGKESELRAELEKLEVGVSDLKSTLLDKETQLQNLGEENENLRTEIKNREVDRIKADEEAVALAEAAKAAEREVQMKLGFATEEADKSSPKATRVVEQLEAVQAANSDLGAEQRRLKVQADQWRKAAEAAAAMLSTSGGIGGGAGNSNYSGNGKMVIRTASLDSHCHNLVAKMDPPFSDDMDDHSTKKRNVKMLKKIGGLWKKGQKP